MTHMHNPSGTFLDPGSTILALLGPTAVGKTAIGVEIARGLEAEIISVDSMQVYRGLDIGTAKPPRNEARGVPVHLVSVVDPDEIFSVVAYKKMAAAAAADIISRNKLPLLVGGSGLYFRALVDDLDFSGMHGHRELGEISRAPTRELHELLLEIDPEAAMQIPSSNRRRILRALEVAHYGERPISDRQNSWLQFESPYDLIAVGLDMDRSLMYRLIEERVDRMLSLGLEQEAMDLEKRGLLRGKTAGEALGYRQLLAYFDGRVTRDEAVSQIKKRTRNYAKRQLTWFKKDPRIKWFRIAGSAGDSLEKLKNNRMVTTRLILEYISKKLEN